MTKAAVVPMDRWHDRDSASAEVVALTTRRKQVRGGTWCGIGMERPKTAQNLGTLWRSAVCLGAGMLFTVGDRYHPTAADTVKSWTHVPYVPYPDLDVFSRARPFDTPIIGVELVPDAKPLETFQHPRRAMYLLGPEDGSLSKRALDLCTDVVSFSSAYCLNVAMAGTVVLYDRAVKLRASQADGIEGRDHHA